MSHRAAAALTLMALVTVALTGCSSQPKRPQPAPVSTATAADTTSSGTDSTSTASTDTGSTDVTSTDGPPPATTSATTTTPANPAQVTARWPDGTPVGGGALIVYPAGFSGDSGTPYDTVAIDAQGHATLTDVPATNAVAFFDLPASAGATDPFNGGRDCWLLMAPAGAAIKPGDMPTWTAEDMPCDTSPFNPSDYPSVLNELLQAQQAVATGGDTTAYGGTWQAARQRVQGS